MVQSCVSNKINIMMLYLNLIAMTGKKRVHFSDESEVVPKQMCFPSLNTQCTTYTNCGLQLDDNSQAEEIKLINHIESSYNDTVDIYNEIKLLFNHCSQENNCKLNLMTNNILIRCIDILKNKNKEYYDSIDKSKISHIYISKTSDYFCFADLDKRRKEICKLEYLDSLNQKYTTSKEAIIKENNLLFSLYYSRIKEFSNTFKSNFDLFSNNSKNSYYKTIYRNLILCSILSIDKSQHFHNMLKTCALTIEGNSIPNNYHTSLAVTRLPLIFYSICTIFIVSLTSEEAQIEKGRITLELFDSIKTSKNMELEIIDYTTKKIEEVFTNMYVPVGKFIIASDVIYGKETLMSSKKNVIGEVGFENLYEYLTKLSIEENSK